jgi:hypothetical protein
VVTSKIQIINGLIGVTDTNNSGTGNDWSSSSVKVDKYFKYGVGLYQVDIKVSGPGGSCSATAYVKLDGNPLSKPIGIAGAVATMLGVAGAAAAESGRGPSPKSRDFTDQLLDATDKDAADQAAQEAQDRSGQALDDAEYVASAIFGCGFLDWGATIMLSALPVFGMGAGGAMLTKPTVVWSKKVRRKGRPILAFFSGVLLGLGAVVLLWQYAVWTLQIWNVIGIPVLLALLLALVAKKGRAYRIERRLVPSPIARADESAPPAPAPAADLDRDPEPPPPAPAG